MLLLPPIVVSPIVVSQMRSLEWVGAMEHIEACDANKPIITIAIAMPEIIQPFNFKIVNYNTPVATFI